MKRKTFLFGLCLSLLTLTVAAQGREVLLEKSFPNKRTVNIKTISGDCLFKRGTTDSITVLVVAELPPAGAVETVVSEEGTALTLQERWVRDHSSGNILWTITLPEGATVNASSLSGDITGEDLKGEFKGKTASGDILISRCEGSFSLRSASGDLTLKNVQGSGRQARHGWPALRRGRAGEPPFLPGQRRRRRRRHRNGTLLLQNRFGGHEGLSEQEPFRRSLRGFGQWRRLPQLQGQPDERDLRDDRAETRRPHCRPLLLRETGDLHGVGRGV